MGYINIKKGQDTSQICVPGGKMFLLHQTAAKRVPKKHIISDLLPLKRIVIMPIKHILYIDNNRQLKWVLCQGVLVTQCTKEHTPCACGIASLIPAIESFM